MSNKIIKNKNREIRASINAGKRIAYQPEYERLNIEPTINKVNPHDFMMGKKKLPPQPQQSQQKLPQSGQNEDIIWSHGLTSNKADRVSVLQEKIRNEILSKEDKDIKEAFDSIDGESSFELVGDHNRRKFRYDDIPNAPSSLIEDSVEPGRDIEDDIGLEEEQEQEEQEEQEQEEEEEEDENESVDSFKLSDLRSGDIILLYNEQVISSGSIEEIKDVLSKILLSSNNYLVEDFVVLKRLNIRAGIFIE